MYIYIDACVYIYIYIWIYVYGSVWCVIVDGWPKKGPYLQHL